MKDYFIKRSDGKRSKIPMYDILVANHFAKESSYVNTLLNDVNDREIYAPLFKNKKYLVFLDIGANIGLVSLYATPSCKRIVALEPDPETFKVLQAMTVMTQIECIQVALAPKIGQVDFYQNDLNTTASSTVNTYGTKTSVLGWTLNEILRVCQLEHVDVCKIDAEGAEDESLHFNHQLLLVKDIIHTFYIEVHNTPTASWEGVMGRLVTDFSILGYYKMVINGMTLRASKP